MTVKSTAQINGEIYFGKLQVEPGAVFNGTCSMGGAVKENEKAKS
jgi:cytoskeletal protein CcmA (bactofilin family)